MNISLIKNVVDNDMCIGCGVCSTQCRRDSIKIKMNQFGFYTANIVGDCDSDCNCTSIKVCPFNPNPNESVKTEREIANIFLTDAEKQHEKLGKYINTYVGYSVKNRLTSSSGGIATYILMELMRSRAIQHVISVSSINGSSGHYEYTISSTVSDLVSSAKTKYYPATLADALKNITKLNGKVAIVGVACFIKAIRLAQIQDPIFSKKIFFLIGIICGGVKSAFFSEYLASKAGVSPDEFSHPEFRVKDLNSNAGDYSYSCLDRNNIEHLIKMRLVGDMWGTGLFKANACDYCDDVTSELADISLGDAWLEPFIKDGRGTNVLITRSNFADNIIKKGMENGTLVIDELPERNFLASQQGSFNHRHDGLLYRIRHGNVPSEIIPPKRFNNIELSILLKIIHSLRMKARKDSLLIWKCTKDARVFDKKMYFVLFLLKICTRINHYQRAIKHRLNKRFIK